MDRASPETERVWLGGAPLDVRLSELAEAGLSRVDALLHLLEWAIRRRPLEEVELLRCAIDRHVADMPLDVLSDLRWLEGFAALRTARYAHALAVLAPLSQFDRFLDRPLGPHERGPQVLAAVLVTQVYRELGARSAADEETSRALDWFGDLGATDYASCSITAGQLWKGAYLIGFELAVGLAEDALADGDLDRARKHAVSARRWLPRRALGRHATVPWQDQITLLLLWSKLALARGWRSTAVRSAELALRLAERHQALPEVARCWYQHGLAILGAPFDPVQYLLDPDGRQSGHRSLRFSSSLGLAAAMAESAGMVELACAAHLNLGALFAPHDRELTLLHIDRAMPIADRIATELPPELVPWWELSRLAKLRLAHIIVHDVPSDHQLWGAGTMAADFEPSAPDRDENEEIQPMQGIDDLPQPPDLEGELRAALHQVGYAIADETGTGAVIAPAADQVGLVVGWQPSPALDKVPASICSGLVMKELAQVLEALGFLARRYEGDPGRLIVKGTYSMLEADDEDDGDRAVRWYDSETEARHVQLGWLADTRVYDVAGRRHGVAGHPLRDLVVRILIALERAGLPLQVDWPNDGLGTDINVAVFPHETDGSYVTVSWEPGYAMGEYQREMFRGGARALIERVLNAAGIVTNGNVIDGTVYVFGKAQERSAARSRRKATALSPVIRQAPNAAEWSRLMSACAAAHAGRAPVRGPALRR
ncbi:MAG: hypothetical protein ABR608_11515 [Pseudonocardiaceae bacterium]